MEVITQSELNHLLIISAINKMAIKKTGTFHGKSNKLGGGGRFAQVVAAMPKGMPLREKKAIAAMQGRKKYGAKKMAKMAAAGRKRKKA